LNEQLNPGWSWEDHPITMVTWEDAVAYCRWVGGRLPTEAEWEYAARGGEEGKKYVWGDAKTPLVKGVKHANVADQSAKRKYSDWTIFEGYDDGYKWTSPVGYFEPNGFGLYDMAGNVEEWCSDWYGEDYYDGSPRRDPQGPSSGDIRVLRGGCWFSNPGYLRSSCRSVGPPDFRDYNLGFRVVRDAE
jgi:sulfatase modifying factor 1